MIKLVDIQKIYTTLSGGAHVLKDINLYFEKGEFVAILGKSGCGKTTLLNLIGGLDSPSSGEIAINGKLVSKMTSGELDEFRNHQIGIVFQNYNLINHLNVLENVMVALDISGDKKEKKEKSIEILKKVGLEEHIYKKVNQLSGGQRQRVAIARAIINNPDIILADEPTGALDKKTSKEVMDLLKEVAKDKLVIFVTHNKNIAKNYSNRIIEMVDGKVVSDSDPHDSRVKVNLDKKINEDKLSFANAMKYSFKSGFANKWKTILTALGLAIGIMAISLVDGVFNSTKNSVDPASINENNRLVYTNGNGTDNCLNDINSYSEFEDSFVIKSNTYTISRINGEKILDSDLYLSYTSGNLYAVPSNKIQYNEYDSNLLYGNLPDESGQVAVSYDVASSLYSFDITEDSVKEKVIGDNIDYLDKMYFTYSNEELKALMNKDGYSYFYYDTYIKNNRTFYLNGEEINYENYGLEVMDVVNTFDFWVSNHDIEELIDGDKKVFIFNENRISGEYNINEDVEFVNFGEYVEEYKNFTIVGVFDGSKNSSIVEAMGIFQNTGYSMMQKTDIESFSDTSNIGKIYYTYIKDDFIDDKAEIIKRFQNDFGYSLYNARVAATTTTSSFLLSLLQFVFTAITSVTLITGAIMLWLLLHVSIVQRKREIGLLRSMGSTKGDVLKIFISETAIIGIIACIIGILLTVIVTPIINYVVPNYFYSVVKDNISFINPAHPISLKASKLFWICFIGIIIAFIAGFIPSSKAGNKKPIESLRGE